MLDRLTGVDARVADAGAVTERAELLGAGRERFRIAPALRSGERDLAHRAALRIAQAKPSDEPFDVALAATDDVDRFDL